MNFEDLLLMVRRRLALILMLGTLGLAFSVHQTSKIIPMFQATATIFVSTPPGSNELGQSNGSQLGELNTGSSFTQARVKSYAKIVNNVETLLPVKKELGLTYGIQELATRVSASSPVGTVLIDVTVEDPDPLLAAQIANSVAFHFSQTVLSIELNSTLDPTKLIKLSTVQRAEPNYSPVSPRKNLNYFLGLFSGLMLALVISLFLRYLDKSMKNEKDLGVTPLLSVMSFDKTAKDHPLVSQLSSYDPRIEAYRQLRTNVLHILENSKDNCIAVTSCFSGEGKTTTSLNFGLVLSNAGFRVLVIEADMRRPTMMKYLSQGFEGLAKPRYGLSSLALVKDVSTLGRILTESTLKLEDSRLEVLVSGDTPQNPAEILGSETFVKLLDEARTLYDYVIVDTPPILAVADASIVARVTKKILLVMHAGETSKSNFEAAREALLNVGVTLTGAVLNKIPKHKAGERYGYSYTDSRKGYYRYSYSYSPSEVSDDASKSKSRAARRRERKAQRKLSKSKSKG